MAAVDRYTELHASYRWNVPSDFNLAYACCTRWAGDRSRFALYWEDEDGARAAYTFWDLSQQANRLSNALASAGVRRGDKVALVLPQRPETAIAHIALYQLGAVAVPLSFLFGPDALEYRLQHSEAKTAFVDPQSLPNLLPIRERCPQLAHVVGVAGAAGPGVVAWDTLLQDAPRHFTPVATQADDPALLIYTSGTTGPPKGALMPHRCLLGNLPGFTHSHNGYPQPGDLFWSPADWAWTGGLIDALLPALYFGQPIVGYRGRFDPERAFRLIERYQIRNTFLFPTALKLMMKAYPRPRDVFDIELRSIMSAGEAVGTTVFEWARDALGVTINEMFGQTEMNYIVGNSHASWPAKPGSMGRPYPGHRIAIIDDEGNEVPRGDAGEVAINRRAPDGTPDPVFFLEYFGNPEGTRNKFTGDWCRTGDVAVCDEDGYFWYQGRADDMFKAAGYRIGPSEIENCLVRHPAVANAAVVPSPDEVRGNVVKAFVVLAPGHAPSAALEADLARHVREHLAPYEYPKEIEFIDALPMTTTGKVQRKVLRERELARKRAGRVAER
ncbi:MAG TPA: AMP-binding protein [Casimicrobiaceae bacterium]|nr:AMP-binding protein [Casimicrobiaceae bacterium]